jgi:hypothetical protein
VAKWAIASRVSAERCGPLFTASQISSLVHGHLVLAEHPNCAHSLSKWAVGCSRACPVGHIKFQWGSCESWAVGAEGVLDPSYTAHCDSQPLLALRFCQLHLLSFCNWSLSCPKMAALLSLSHGGLRPSHVGIAVGPRPPVAHSVSCAIIHMLAVSSPWCLDSPLSKPFVSW